MMYSRNTSRRNVRPTYSASKPEEQTVSANSAADKPAEKEAESVAVLSVPQEKEEVDLRKSFLPQPPPNYGGIMYDEKVYESLSNEYLPDDETISAEGIGRLVKNDASYSDHGKKIRRRDYMLKRGAPDVRGGEGVFVKDRLDGKNGSRESNRFKPSAADSEGVGLKRIVDGLQDKKFSPEELLICAMILLMLNSSSEDDIIMVLVLMALL